MYYTLDMISYCFPFDTSKRILNRINQRLYGQPELYGVLAPYVDKQMTEQEADDFLCEVIRKHPFVKDAMCLDIYVMWHDGNMSGFYQTLNIRNPKQGVGRQKYEPSPVQWR